MTTVDEIAEVIRSEDPDLVLLQEVDRGARRTWYVDEHAELLNQLPQYKAEASTWCWHLPWLPFPLGLGEMLGRCEMHLAVLSKYALRDVRRVPLPAIKSDGVLGRFFNLRRAIQLITLPTSDGGPPVTVLHTHLSAFTSGDGTVEEQVQVVRELLASVGRRWLLAGDFNSLPPGVSAEGLTGQAAIEYPVLDVPTPILPLFEDAASAVPLHEMSDPATAHKWHTLKYYGKAEPVVTVDYCLHSPADWKVEHVRVPREYGWPSDHAPLVASLRVVQ